MNYLTHAHQLLLDLGDDVDPYEIAGTSLPDWLGVVDRKVRVRSAAAATVLGDPNPQVIALARGVMRHHHDDGWFHETETFRLLCVEFAQELRQRCGDDTGMRSGFVGHVLVEILLDATLSERHLDLLDRYYRAVGLIDPLLIQTCVDRLSRVTSERVAGIVPRLISEGFLRDYSNDEKLRVRLNQVMRRVRLPELPETLLEWLPEARERVRESCDALITAPVPFSVSAHLKHH